jgi:hypothetical protein
MPKLDAYLQELIDRTVLNTFTDIRLRTEFTDETVLLSGQEVLDILMGRPVPPSPNPSMGKRVLSLAKPTLVINSPTFGKRIWAPYGEASAKAPEVWRGKMKLWLAGGVVGLVGLGFALGRVTAGRKSSLKGLSKRRR